MPTHRRKPKNQAAVALGRLAAGKPKNFSPEELAKRTERIQAVNAARKKTPHANPA